ncbi:hypothetical protein EIP91_002112 [Steccherinum ochraceum]|uniref:F-box domain-containing protein n=1 Tax=Steccherinum ochraceum TaxID=92696 RepID=A0A4R0RSB1_9APHY|nr:hypothetical protein EIP91_002112 [Steccherinum ochraceum]
MEPQYMTHELDLLIKDNTGDSGFGGMPSEWPNIDLSSCCPSLRHITFVLFIAHGPLDYVLKDSAIFIWRYALRLLATAPKTVRSVSVLFLMESYVQPEELGSTIVAVDWGKWDEVLEGFDELQELAFVAVLKPASSAEGYYEMYQRQKEVPTRWLDKASQFLGQNSRSTLLSLSLVSKSWSNAAQIALFYRIELDSFTRIHQFLVALQALPSLADYVFEIRFGRWPQSDYVNAVSTDNTNTPNILEITAMLPNLSCVEIAGFLLGRDMLRLMAMAPPIPYRRQINTLEIGKAVVITSDALDVLLFHFSASTLRLSSVSIQLSARPDRPQDGWEFDAASCSTIRRLETDGLLIHVLNTSSGELSEASVLQPFARGILESLCLPDCPLFYRTNGLTLLASFLGGDEGGRNLRTLQLNLSGRDGGDDFLSGDSETINLAQSCPRLQSISVSLRLFPPDVPHDSHSTEMLPGWRYATRLIASANSASLTCITIYVICRKQDDLSGVAVSDTVFAQVDWTYFDEVLSGDSFLEAVEFKPRWISEIASTAGFTVGFTLDAFLREKMRAAAARGIIQVGPPGG